MSAPACQIGAMNVQHPFRMRAAQIFVAIFETRAAEIGERGIVGLQHGPHGAIDNQNARGKGVVKLLAANGVHIPMVA